VKSNPLDQPEELWQPLDEGPGWFILDSRLKLIGRLPPGIAQTAGKAVTEFLRRSPIVAARLSETARSEVIARRDPRSPGEAA
jgi:hypothetical protein